MTNQPTDVDDVVLAATDDNETPGIYDLFETDAAAEEDGRWFENFFGQGIDGAVKLRGLLCNAAVQARQRLDTRYSKYMKNGVYPREIQEKMHAELLAEAVLVDWRGTVFRDRGGKPIEYSKAAAKVLLSSMKHFRSRITLAANNIDAFRVEATEDAVKN